MQRLRLTYAVDFPLHYASALDRAKVWERATRRAGLTLVYSSGFSPRPRMQDAAALPVGFRAQAELLDLWLAEPADPAEVQAALSAALPAGLTVRQVEEVALDEPALPAQVRAAEYSVAVETATPAAEVRCRLADLLAAEQLPRQRRGRPYDLRPLIEGLWLESEGAGEIVLAMILAAREGATGRPEEVLDALGLGDDFCRVRRRHLILESERPGEGP